MTANAISLQRFEAIWAARGPQNDLSRVITPAEVDIVNARWRVMPGSSCWMDAFFALWNEAKEREEVMGDKQAQGTILDPEGLESLERALCALADFEGPIKDALAAIGRPTIALGDVCAALRRLVDD